MTINLHSEFVNRDTRMKNEVSKVTKRREYSRRWMSHKRRSLPVANNFSQYLMLSLDDDDENTAKAADIHADANVGPAPEISEVTDTVEEHILTSNSDVAVTEYKANVDGETKSDLHVLDAIAPRLFTHYKKDSTDSDSDYLANELTFAQKLAEWVNQCDIKGCAVDRLLKLLKSNGHPELPSSWRTLLHSPRTVEIQTISGMLCHHFELNEMLVKSLCNVPSDDIRNISSIDIMLNIDGLPLFKSSNSSAWPVLCRAVNVRSAPVFPISIGVGRSKPCDLTFLQNCVDDIQIILANGIVVAGKQFPVILKAIICDAPARAMVKCIKQYSGYYGCDKCKQRGEFRGRMTFPQIFPLVLRTDEEFRSNAQKGHHNGVSPFTQISTINMIDDFPVDYMHQTCLGVMRRLLLIWMRGPPGKNRLSAYQISQISCRLTELRQFIPTEFGRRPRPLDEVDRWKATEFRQLLIYTGQFVLKGILSSKQYTHFKAFMVALCILLSPTLVDEYSHYANELLQYFVSKGARKSMYGRDFLVYNVHSLLHLEREARRFGSLDYCAAWPFENYMQQLKRKVRSAKNPVVQIVKRVREQAATTIKSANIKIHSRRPNNAFKTSTGKYCEVIKVNSRSANTYLCRVYHSYASEPLFTKPCDSEAIMGLCKFKKSDCCLKIVHGEILTTRCMLIPRGKMVVFLPLLHCLN